MVAITLKTVYKNNITSEEFVELDARFPFLSNFSFVAFILPSSSLSIPSVTTPLVNLHR